MGKKKQKQKTNPRKIPKTQADCDKSYQNGADFGCVFCLTLSILALKDKFWFSNEQITEFRKSFQTTLESYNAGEIKFRDVKQALLGDYDITVRLE